MSDVSELTTPGARLRAARAHIGASQSDLGRALGVSKQSVSGYENQGTAPGFAALRDAFGPHGVSAAWILTGEGSMLEAPPREIRMSSHAPPSALHSGEATGPVLFHVVDDSGRRFAVVRPFPAFELTGEAPEINVRELAGFAFTPNHRPD